MGSIGQTSNPINITSYRQIALVYTYRWAKFNVGDKGVCTIQGIDGALTMVFADQNVNYPVTKEDWQAIATELKFYVPSSYKKNSTEE